MPHPNKARKQRAPKRRRSPEVFDDSPDGIVKRIDAEIESEEQEREARRRASGQRWAPIMEPLFWLAMLSAVLTICAGFKLPQGLFGLSALSAVLSFVSAYAVHRSAAVAARFPVRSGLINGVSISIAGGRISLGVMILAVQREYF